MSAAELRPTRSAPELPPLPKALYQRLALATQRQFVNALPPLAPTRQNVPPDAGCESWLATMRVLRIVTGAPVT